MEDHNQPTTNMEAQTAKDLYHSQVNRWKYLWVATFIAFALSMSFNLVIMLTLWDTAEQTNQSLEILRKATSPEAQAAQGEVIQSLVITIDCNNREAIQELIDQLPVQEGVTVITPECKENP